MAKNFIHLFYKNMQNVGTKIINNQTNFKAPNIGVINPAPLSNSPIQDTLDSFQSQKEKVVLPKEKKKRNIPLGLLITSAITSFIGVFVGLLKYIKKH